MKPGYLLDTNILIHIRQRRPQHVLARLSERTVGEVAMSVITLGELSYGVAKSGSDRGREVLDELVSLIPVLPMPLPATRSYGELRALLASRGEIIGNNDLWIAAHCLAEDFILVTNNTREFQRVPWLRLQNWAEPSP